LRVGIEAIPSSLDPRFASDADSSRIAGLVHCSLVEPDEAGGWAPSLAVAWRAADPQTWEFDLDPSARFHDGSPVTARDVVASYRAVLDPHLASPKRAALLSLRAVEEDGPRRVRMRLAAPDAAFLEGATLAVLEAADAASPRRPDGRLSGCGPYRLAASDARSTRLVATREGGDAPSIREIEFRVVPDAVMRTLQLEAGELDLVQNALEPDAVRHLEAAAPHLRVSRTPYDAYQYLGLNHRHPALAKVRVRRAIAHAIDREAIVQHLLGGQAEVAGGLLPSHHAAYEGRLRRYAFDPVRARKLLDRAGLVDPDGDGPLPRLKLRYSTSTVELRRRIAEAIAANLADVGIAVSIESWEWGTFFADIARGNYDLYSLAWIGIRDPDLMRVVFHSAMTPPAGSNRGYFSNPRIDRLTERGRAETAPQRRRTLYGRVQKAAARQLPYVPLWWPRNVVVASTRLEGFSPRADGGLQGLANARLTP
jgi:peptide/nickel transport system substrate-binding protein